MTFEDWFHEVENYSMRWERFYEESRLIDKEHEVVLKWLKAAYEAGREHEKLDIDPI